MMHSLSKNESKYDILLISLQFCQTLGPGESSWSYEKVQTIMGYHINVVSGHERLTFHFHPDLTSQLGPLLTCWEIMSHWAIRSSHSGENGFTRDPKWGMKPQRMHQTDEKMFCTLWVNTFGEARFLSRVINLYFSIAINLCRMISSI